MVIRLRGRTASLTAAALALAGAAVGTAAGPADAAARQAIKIAFTASAGCDEADGFAEETGKQRCQVTAFLPAGRSDRKVLLQYLAEDGSWIAEDSATTRRGRANLLIDGACQAEDGSDVWCEGAYSYRIVTARVAGLEPIASRIFQIEFIPAGSDTGHDGIG